MLVTDAGVKTGSGRNRFGRFGAVTELWRSAGRCPDDQDRQSHPDHSVHPDGGHGAAAKASPPGGPRRTAPDCPRLEIVRTPRLVGRGDPDVHQILCLLHGGTGSLEQAGRTARLRAGELVVVDGSLPCRGWLQGPPELLRALVVHVPRALLPLPPGAVRELLARPVALDRGLGGALSHWLTDVCARADEFAPADLSALASVTVDLLVPLLGRSHRAGGRPESTEDRRGALRQQIQDHIRRHLADPELSPASVARAHSISLRYLYQLFREQEVTVAGWIRQCRLERCRRDLADPGQSFRTIHAIAARWGF
ncbi:helix-turn-helix domain-containing protein, partial [Streptomyces katsurahamanus]|nr:helix-turn-helix domain-containing protein [Streptomyces katsurahamanus]